MRKFGLFFLLSAVLCHSAFAATSEAGPPKIVLNPSGTGAGATGELKFKELVANGQNYTGFKAPDTLAGNPMYTLPSADGTSGYVLSTNGSGVLSWVLSGALSDGDKGDITVSGSGGTFTIDNTAVAFAKIQNVATDRLAGRDTASSGPLEEITVGGGIEFTGSAGIQRSALTGDVTAPAGSASTTIANNAVTTAKILDANVTTAKITDANVTLAKLESRARPIHNHLVNGGYDFFQRGQYSALTTGSNLDTLYRADRWYWLVEAGGVGNPTYTYKRVDAAAEGAKYACELGVSGGTNDRYFGISQIVRSVNSIPLRGRTVRFQSRIKQASSTANWKAVIIEWTGTADGSVTREVVGTWSSGTYTEGNFFATDANYAITAVGSDTSVGTSYTDVFVTGTVGSSTNNLYCVLVCTTANPTNSTITKSGLYDGVEAREWLPRLSGTELALCQEHYEKGMAVDTAPADNVLSDLRSWPGVAYTVDDVAVTVPFKVRKWKNPQMTLYNALAASPAGRGQYFSGGGWVDFTSNTATAVGEYAFGFSGVKTASFTAGQSFLVYFSWVADSEF